MKKLLVLGSICFVLLIIDNALIPFFSIRGFHPNLLFSFVISFSIIDGSWNGLWLGVFSGALQDVYFFNGFGINMFVNMLICVIAGFIGTGIFKEKLLVPVMACFGLSVLKGLMVFSILYVTKQYINLSDIIFNSLYTMVLSVFIYKFVYRLSQKEYMQKKWKF